MNNGLSTHQLIWRSLLFVPANNGRFIEKAHTRGADGIILDLEDSVPVGERLQARRALMDSAALAARGGADVLVRINAEPDESAADLDAAVHPGVRALLVPKVEDPEALCALSDQVARREAQRGRVSGGVGFVVLVESAAGLLRAEAIARAEPRTLALELGGEDFALSTGMLPDAETLAVPKQMVLYAARSAGLIPLGILGSIADYADLDAYRITAQRSRRFGFEGAACIHPSGVPILNDVFTPTAAEAAHAQRLVDTYADAQRAGSGAVSVDGKMIDVPIVERARQLLARVQAIRARQAATQS
ncbi:MAG: CoA ester lyase [Gammaproteobacteria bacterium]|nr:CoA ester lyase [Gammaproteobacteria bacterium]MDX2459456.1 CoA ester lyase [Gammaproteobacteria bacterium]